MTGKSSTPAELEALRVATNELELKKLKLESDFKELRSDFEELEQRLAFERMRAASRAGRVPK